MPLVVALLFLFQNPAGISSDEQTRALLTSRYVGKLVTVAGFPSGSRLRFDADGKLLRGTPGAFTLDGNVHVETVNMRADRVDIVGRRAFLAFNPTIGKLEEHPTQERITLEFLRKANTPIEATIEKTLMSFEQLAKAIPAYWVKYLNGSPVSPTVTDPETGELVPRASEAQGLIPYSLRQVVPQYPPDIRAYGISGTVLLRVIVDEQGKPRVVDLVAPMGFGLDQAAIDAVHKWDYQPAKKDGKPVKVYLRVQFNFSPPQ
jgi:TonB family protein